MDFVYLGVYFCGLWKVLEDGVCFCFEILRFFVVTLFSDGGWSKFYVCVVVFRILRYRYSDFRVCRLEFSFDFFLLM